jgi:hypothetical protein
MQAPLRFPDLAAAPSWPELQGAAGGKLRH